MRETRGWVKLVPDQQCRKTRGRNKLEASLGLKVREARGWGRQWRAPPRSLHLLSSERMLDRLREGEKGRRCIGIALSREGQLGRRTSGPKRVAEPAG